MINATCHGYLPFSEYRQLDAVNFSSLKHMDWSPYTYRYWSQHERKDTDDFREGRAAHTLILEQHAFDARYVVWDKLSEAGNLCPRRGKDWETFAAAAQRKRQTVLLPSQKERVFAQAIAVRSKDANQEILCGGTAEQSFTWVEKETGILCKCRVDKSNERLVDVKGARSIDAFKFGRAAGDLLYHAQLAAYQDGLAAVTGKTLPCCILAFQKLPPYESAVFELPEHLLEQGRATWIEWLKKLRHCRENNHWPQRYELPQQLQLPAWMTEQDEDDISDQNLDWGDENGSEDQALH